MTHQYDKYNPISLESTKIVTTFKKKWVTIFQTNNRNHRITATDDDDIKTQNPSSQERGWRPTNSKEKTESLNETLTRSWISNPWSRLGWSTFDGVWWFHD